MGRPLDTPNVLPDREKLEGMFYYESETGKLFWKPREVESRHDGRFNAMFAGKEVGGHHSGGYRRLTIDGVHYMTHRVIWKMVTGEDALQVDHINGDTSDNRISNLRDVSHQVNAKNRKLYKNNTSGTPGVTFHSRDNVWIAKIGAGGKQLQLGSFKTADEAAAAIQAAHVLLEYHENHGRLSA